MDSGQFKDTEPASLAWRKRPRKFSPKSRLGCKTCKIRRVKCDLGQPSCLKCRSTGRTCDGYSDGSRDHRSQSSNSSESSTGHYIVTTASADQPEQWYVYHDKAIFQNLGPLLVLPITGLIQAETMSFFEYISIKNLSEYHLDDSWQKTLMFFSQTVPSVRYAAMALASLQRRYLDHNYSNRTHLSHSSAHGTNDNTALVHYNRAIKLLLNQENGNTIETTAITLLVCYLFTCFDHLAGNYVQAIKHLRGGVELARNLEITLLADNGTNDDVQSSGVQGLTGQITRQIHRLDLQAVTFLVDWIPADVQEALHASQTLRSDEGFQSLGQAADHLHILVARVMELRNREQEMSLAGETPPPTSSSVRDVILEQLETWSILFERTQLLRQERDIHEVDSPKPHPLVALLRLQYTIAWVLLSSHGPGREMEFDKFLPQFQRCIALAREVAVTYERYSGSRGPTFTPEIGMVPVLYIIGVKCRHPVVRREVLSILKRRPIREAVWDSISAARVVERTIEIEEGGRNRESGTTQIMEQIAIWQRIETLSWVQQSAIRLDITYTFCAREGLHCEFLDV